METLAAFIIGIAVGGVMTLFLFWIILYFYRGQ